MQPIFQNIVEHWHRLGEFFAFDAALLAEPSMVFRLALLGVLLVLSAFFSSSETALFSLSRLDLQQLRRQGDPHSDTLHALLDQPRRLIISILAGNELKGLGLTKLPESFGQLTALGCDCVVPEQRTCNA